MVSNIIKRKSAEWAALKKEELGKYWKGTNSILLFMYFYFLGMSKKHVVLLSQICCA